MNSYHVVKKKIKYYDKTLKDTVIPLDNNGYCFELFNSDVFCLVQAEKFGLLEIKKEELTSVQNPLGSAQNSPETASRAISLLHQKWMEEKGIRFNSKSLIFL